MNAVVRYLFRLSSRSLGWVTFILVASSIVIVVAVFYQLAQNVFEEKLRVSLEQLASSIATMIDHAVVSHSPTSDTTGHALECLDEDYLLRFMREYPEVRSIRVIRTEGARLHSQFALSNPSTPATPLAPDFLTDPAVDTALSQVWATRSPLVIDPREEAGERVAYAFAPIAGRGEGRKAAWAAVGFNIDHYRQEMGQLQLAASVVLFSGLGFSWLFAWLAASVRRVTIERLNEHQRAEAVLREARDAAKRADDAKAELLAVAAHDLRNPISAILGLAQLAELKLRKLPVSEDRDRIETNLGRIFDTGHAIGRILENLMATTILDRGGLKLPDHPVKLEELVEESLELNKPSAGRKRIEILVEIEGDYWVKGDRMRLFEAIDNLVNNAVKYSPLGSVVHLSLKSASQTRVLFAVKDQGPGLSQSDKAKLFQQFQRLSAKPTAGETSTGLGLSIVKKIVEVHHGKVWCESEIGEGATFFIELPITEPPIEEGFYTEQEERAEIPAHQS